MTGYLFHVDPRANAEQGDELAIQVRMRTTLLKIAPKLRFVATPNGARRTMWEARKSKAEGLAAGFPDATILWPGGIAFVEIKARNGSLSVDQINWLNWLTQAGFNCGVFNNSASLFAKLREWGAPVPAMKVAA
ncbi:VRR-NUC domain-containing protein [Rhizorhabdus histidinilytica]|uniref:VRR-NUC domain-containing protein n=1 Tax=Rhizorhabdus histidinilytica TaxID=439228 RepID=A0A1T5A8X5_9SPHN|nr:VRR-NUC domain-containing protein [Rhizorhabdus histidinilytica]SKB31123.1 VRR-NUC domain-containing protein [Rhizorhabdus histidinilytica]